MLDDNYWAEKRKMYKENFGNFDTTNAYLTEKEKNNVLKFLLNDYDKTQRAGMGTALNLSVSFYVQGTCI